MSAVHTSCCNILGLWHPCCTGASCVPVTWSGLDEYHLVAVGLWPDWLQLHGGMLHCSCNLQVITSSWWLGNLKEVTGLSVQEARDGRCMSAWAVYAELRKTQRIDTGTDLRVCDYHCLPVALIWVKSLSQRIGPSHSQRSWELRINSRKHFKLGQELSFEKWILAINELILPK
jgi:hypothetical protein